MADRVHFIGIGGTGMSGLARILRAKGCVVTGSDMARGDAVAELERSGITVMPGHRAEHVGPSTAWVVRSAAVKDDNPEVVEAQARGIRVLKYSEALGEAMKEKIGIAVAGCHGKTTTTAMISYLFDKTGVQPSYLCGGWIPQLNGNAAWGPGRHFIAEACEYDRSFLNLSPQAAIITNIEEDHLDYYKDIGEIVSAFRDYASLVGKTGIVIGCRDNPHVARIVEEYKERGESYGLGDGANWTARNIRVEKGLWRYEVLKYGKQFGEFTLSIPGVHNVCNSLAAIAAAAWAGVGVELIQLSLREFQGVGRRFQLLGERNGVTVIDDYAHHPSEIQALLRAAKERYPDRKIWAIFQPHQHSRTRRLLKEFAASFADAHLVLLPDIFYARDDASETKRVSSADLASALDGVGKAALYLPKFDDILAFVGKKVEPGTVLLTIGAGNVHEIAECFLRGEPA